MWRRALQVVRSTVQNVTGGRLTQTFKPRLEVPITYPISAKSTYFNNIPSIQTSLNFSSLFRNFLHPCNTRVELSRTYATLEQMHKSGPHKKFRPPRRPLDGAPMLKGVILKTLIKKPKKPNSANRKCVLVRLSNGKEAVAYVPGIGHNLQEHNIVLVRCGRLQDVPGVKLKCIRGVYDLPHVQKQVQ